MDRSRVLRQRRVGSGAVPFKKKNGADMYIGVGTIVLILVIVLIVSMMRGR